MRRAGIAVALAGATACVDSAAREIPEPPDMAPLLAAYDEPTAELTQEVADDALPVLRGRLEPAQQIEYLEYLQDEAIEPAVEKAEGDDPDAPPFGLRAEGDARVEHICRGEGDAPSPERDGYLEFVMTFRETGIDPVFWGNAVECRYLIADREIIIDGRVRAHRGDAFLFWLDATVVIAGRIVLEGQLDFRAARRSVELLVPVGGDAHLVYRIDFDEGVSVRAANGTFVCDASGGCENEEGERVTFAELPQ